MLYSDRMESLDIFLLLSSFLVGGSRKRLRFSGTEAAARPLGIELDAELEPGYGERERSCQSNYTYSFKHILIVLALPKYISDCDTLCTEKKATSFSSHNTASMQISQY